MHCILPQRLDGVLCFPWPQVKPQGAVQRRHLQRLQLPEDHQGVQASAGLLDGIHQLHSSPHLHRCVRVANAIGTKHEVIVVILHFCFLFLPQSLFYDPESCNGRRDRLHVMWYFKSYLQARLFTPVSQLSFF